MITVSTNEVAGKTIIQTHGGLGLISRKMDAILHVLST